MSWTDEQIQELRTKWLAGGSLRGIAEEMGRKPGSVSGKLGRLGLLGVKRLNLSVHQSGAFDRGRTEEHREDMQTAMRAAESVNCYWMLRGHNPNARAEFKDGCWQVISDLVNGLPVASQKSEAA
jgi:hypothetical protein